MSRGTTAARSLEADRELQLAVLAELNRDRRLTPAAVGVAVSRGVVTLVGAVAGHTEIRAAADVAVRVPGVHEVVNELTVDGAAGETDDAKIARAARHALGWNTAVPDERIDLVVRSGVVTMRGSVDHWYERSAARTAVAAVPGVVSVNDEIAVLIPPADDAVLRSEVEDALSHVPACGSIDVRVADGVVTLVGDVGSRPIREQAEAAASSSCGIRSVINHLRVR